MAQTKEHKTPELGCVIEAPDERDYKYEILLGAGTKELPDEYVIEDVPHFYQNGIDACVGMAGIAAKSVQEKTKLSPRYAWHLAKKRQNYIGWGTGISQMMKGIIEEGALPYGTIDEEVVGVDRMHYMKPEITAGMQEVAKHYKAKSFWRAGYGHGQIEQVKQALYNEKIPLVVSMYWYAEYDRPVKGFIPKPKLARYGHAFVVKGWKKDKAGREYIVFQNSWSNKWGDKGDFYIYTDELQHYKLESFFVITDIEKPKARILANLDGKLVRNANHPAHYFVSAGKIAWIKNEESFYFGRDGKFWGDWSDTVVVEENLQEMYDLVF